MCQDLNALWVPPEPNGGRVENCAILLLTGGLNDDTCNGELCTVCRFDQMPELHLRGVCPGVQVDVTFNLITSGYGEAGRYLLQGWRHSKITWHPDLHRWQIVSIKDGAVVASCNSTADYPLGVHRWYFTSLQCRDPGQAFRLLHLHSCGWTEVPCRTGHCIRPQQRCDRTSNCQDNSDEEDCGIVSIPNSYLKSSPPPKLQVTGFGRQTNLTSIKVTVKIIQIVNVDLSDGTFTVQFQMLTQWADPRLSFHFLKEGKENLVPKQNGSFSYDIWTPDMIFFNTREILSTSRIESDRSSVIKIERRGKAKTNFLDELDKHEIFSGADNPLNKESYFAITFDCNFEMEYYPFDIQTCSMIITPDFAASRYVELIAKKVEIQNKHLGQYLVEEVSVQPWKEEQKNGLKITVLLSRDPTSIFMTTYLPTIIINFINAITSFWDGPGQFEAVVTVNLTCLMVLSALYISVSEGLAVSSSKVKMVDIWLLFNLLFPFAIVLLHTYVQYQRARMNLESPMKKRKCSWNVSRPAKARLGLLAAKVLVPVVGTTFMTGYWLYGLCYLSIKSPFCNNWLLGLFYLSM